MDPNLAAQWMASGDLPNFSALAEQGYFAPLATTIPAQSPVAWSSFATGLNPGAHGIYDFLRRDPSNYLPSFSVSETIFPDSFIEFGDWKIPLEDAVIRNRRVGTPFWTDLESQGGSATVIRVPVTFPPDDIDYMVAGMGVPDLLGTQGTYTIYSTRPLPGGQSGRVMYMKAQEGGRIETVLEGPPHPLTSSGVPLKTPLEFYPDDGGTGVILGDSQFVLGEGEWSDWVNVSFNLLGVINVHGLVKLYLLEDYPRPRVYVSPIQIDPHNPVVPITSPAGYAGELADRIGLFHTIGMPEETWSLNNGHLTDEAFLDVARTTLAEREAMLFDALENNHSDIVVAVFVQTDRVSHMFYRGIDPEHALYEETDEQGRNAIAWSYREADRIVGRTLESMHENDRLIIISDHGFSPFRWSVHMNRWLLDNGYMALKKGSKESGIGFEHVDWTRTRAYAVGLNGLYLNTSGREAQGIVEEKDIAALKQDISQRLLGFHDDERDRSVVKIVYDGAQVYPENENGDAPDLVVGYQPGYRASWQTSLGAVPGKLVDINRNKWSGDHCIAVDEVPGVLFTSFKPDKPAESIHQVASFLLENWKDTASTQ
jgi:predicted AlkP superfamily phosphohydrolase/phosphomutase